MTLLATAKHAARRNEFLGLNIGGYWVGGVKKKAHLGGEGGKPRRIPNNKAAAMTSAGFTGTAISEERHRMRTHMCSVLRASPVPLNRPTTSQVFATACEVLHGDLK